MTARGLLWTQRRMFSLRLSDIKQFLPLTHITAYLRQPVQPTLHIRVPEAAFGLVQRKRKIPS